MISKERVTYIYYGKINHQQISSRCNRRGGRHRIPNAEKQNDLTLSMKTYQAALW